MPAPRRGQNMPVILAAHFERLIATQELLPGSRLPSERELAESFDVSRSTLREAMHELEAKRLIERRPGRGTTVLAGHHNSNELRTLEIDHATQAHAAELREIIEPSIAALAATRATPSNVLQLSNVLDMSHENLLQSESLRLDVEFHLLLARAAQNPLLESLQAMSSEWTHDVRQYSHATRAGRRVSTRGHHRILQAVRDRDAAAAQAAMVLHLEEVKGLIAKAATRRAARKT
jgi:GntR family transcriptional repressor for pyruvate dehydrogenase complex